MYIKSVIGTSYQNWTAGDCVFIEAPTGSGKTTFILDVLLPFAERKGTEILYLCNRSLLKEQLKVELAKRQDLPRDMEWLEGVEEFAGITVLSYQKLQVFYENASLQYPETRYEFIVCDEIHYIIEDSAFNPETFRSLEFLKREKGILIAISATMAGVDDILIEEKYGESVLWNTRTRNSKYLEIVGVKGYLSSILGEFRKIYFYTLPQIVTKDPIFYFQTYETVLDRINKTDCKEKWLIFQGNKQRANDLKQRIGKEACVISAENKQDDVLDELVRTEQFSCRVLIATKLLDNGINIKDVQLKHIVIDTISKTEFLQMFGRKRRANSDDMFTLYIPQKSGRTFQGYLTPEMWQTYNLLDRDVQTNEICSRIMKEKNYYDMISRFFIWEKGTFVKNPLAKTYYERQKKFVTRMKARMRDDPWAFIQEQLSWLGREKEFNSEKLLERQLQLDMLLQIQKILDEVKNVKLEKDAQQQLRIKLSELLLEGNILPPQGSRLLGKKKINEICRYFNIPVRIKSINGKRKGEETIWIVQTSEGSESTCVG